MKKAKIPSEKHHKVPQWLLKNFSLSKTKDKNVWFLSKNFVNHKRPCKVWDKPKTGSTDIIFRVLDKSGQKIECESGITFVQDIKKYWNMIENNELSYQGKLRISGFLYSLLLEEVILECKTNLISPYKILNIETDGQCRNILNCHPHFKDLIHTICPTEDTIIDLVLIIKRLHIQSKLLHEYDWQLLDAKECSASFAIGDKPILKIPSILKESIHQLNAKNFIHLYVNR